jgi:hypothetical protein
LILPFVIALTFGWLARSPAADRNFVRHAFALPQPILGIAALDANADGQFHQSLECSSMN